MFFTLTLRFGNPLWLLKIKKNKLINKSPITVAAGTFVTSIILMVAHWQWMDPSIGNLQPVLNSYWLMIHVAVIVASYGPFTLAMVLGLVALFLMIFTNAKNKNKIKLSIDEITYINEMALTVGLVMLTIGNFLGGQWANESWGRYWGWDPKETWALISIMVYAFVIHARFVPALRGRWIYNVMSVLAFASILMTYFGVNFYLSGLHSYASGDQIVSYKFILISLIVIFIIGVFSYFRGYCKERIFIKPFFFNGKIGKKEFFWTLMIRIVFAILINQIYNISFTTYSIIILCVLIIFYLWFTIAQGTKRCNDIGINFLYQFIPFSSVILIFIPIKSRKLKNN